MQLTATPAYFQVGWPLLSSQPQGVMGILPCASLKCTWTSRLCGLEAEEQRPFSRSPLQVIQPIMTLVRKPGSSEQSSLVLSS